MGRSQLGSALLVIQSKSCVFICLCWDAQIWVTPARSCFSAVAGVGMTRLRDFMIQTWDKAIFYEVGG